MDQYEMESSNKRRAAVSQRGAAPSSSDGELANPPIRGQYSEKTIAQTSVKRVFSFAQIFFFALTYMSSWEGIAANLGAVLVNGGPQSLVWGILIVVPGALAQAGSLAEMAAMQPIAGAQYHWIDHLAPPKYRRLITWMQGWITWFAWISVMAGVANAVASTIQGLAILNYPDYVPEAWHITLIMFAILIFGGLMNMYTFWIIPWVEMLAGILHVALFIVYVVVLISLAPRHSADFVFFHQESFSGWTDKFVSWNLGLLTPVWPFIAFDGVVHMSEEVRVAKKAIPRTLFWTNAVNGVMAYGMIIVILFTMGPVEQVLNASFPIVEICRYATGSVQAATAMVCGVVVIGLSGEFANIASVSRLTWAWSRDGALPAWFSYIDKRHSVPIRAVWLPILIVMCLGCLHIASTAAFGAFSALSSLGLFASYIMAIATMLHARLRHPETLKFGDWHMGRWGLPVNIFALVYSCYVIIWLPFPQFKPVSADNMNYSAPIFLGTTLLAVLLWVFYASKNWPGLNREVIRLVVEGGEMRLK